MFACEEHQDGDLRLYTTLYLARLVDAASSPEQNMISANIQTQHWDQLAGEAQRTPHGYCRRVRRW